MYLKRLELSGFKSFASHTTFLFEQGLTAVVGPNGSGKSNVTDALRWVFGEQRQSLLRGKKADDVIFAGSDKKSRASLAEVTAVFDNADKRMPLDASEVAISRRVDRSGNSTYLINGGQVRLADVTELILQSGIGTARAAVISQGTVDQLVAGGPQELKLLLDEASGVRIYYLRRDKALRRLEQTASNLLRAEDRLKELEPRLKLLRRQVERFSQREALERNLRELHMQWFGSRLSGLIQQLQEVAVREVSGQQYLESQEAEIRRLQTERELNIVELQTCESERDKLRTKEDEIATARRQLLEKQTILQARLAVSATGVSNAFSLKDAINKKEALRTTLETSSRENESLRIEVLSIRARLADVVAQIAGLRGELVDMSEAVVWEEIRRQVEGASELVEKFCEQAVELKDIEAVKNLARKFLSDFQDFRRRALQLLQTPAQKHQSLEEIRRLENIQEQLQVDILASETRLAQVAATRNIQQSELDNTERQLHELQQLSSESSDTNVSNELAQISVELQELEIRQGHLLQAKEVANANESKLRLRVRQLDERLLALSKQVESIRQAATEVVVEKTRLDTHLEQLKSEVLAAVGESGWRDLQQSQPTEFALSGSLDQLSNQILQLRRRLETIGEVDELTLKEHSETEQHFAELSDQVEDLRKSAADLKLAVNELDERIHTTFRSAFEKIDEKFQEYFRLLFSGGRANLSLLFDVVNNQGGEEEDAESPPVSLQPSKVVSGIDIKATPPGKKLAHVSALSGGERALTAIALLCALIACFPAPVIVLDEADAALDEANTMRFGQILSSLSHQTQFITVTHNRETMHKADLLYGVTMGDDGVSRVLSIRFDQATVYAK